MIRFYNTRTRTTEDFVPKNAGKVTMYTCGPTVYSYLHIGNWVAYIYWDTVVRLLKAHDIEVNRVMNITDVGHLVSDEDEGEDKMQKGARRENKTAWEVAKFYGDYFVESLPSLNILSPTHLTRATEFIDQQLALVRTLKQKGHTYQTYDGIYFDTATFPTYGDFARLNLEELKAGARVEFNKEKRNPSDFALWKFSPQDEQRDMEWPTPDDLLEMPGDECVMGFPGWHIECSAMAMELLGNSIDIHTGGIDHIPVHHTNEIAQSEAATGEQFANLWLHNNHLKVGGVKISKSIGNGYTLEDLAEKGFSPLDFRLFVLQSHYQTEGNFTFSGLESAKNRLSHWREIACMRWQIFDDIQKNTAKEDTPSFAANRGLLSILGDNLNTPESLAFIDQTISEIEQAKPDCINRRAFNEFIETVDSLLGLQIAQTTPDVGDAIKQKIIERTQVRQAKDWQRSDEIRDELLAQGVALRDTTSGTYWYYL